MLAPTALLSGLIDYAGLFPPAALDMAATVRNYASYRRGPDGWMLGRLIVPATRLAEFEAVRSHLPDEPSPAPWRLSALIGTEVDADVGAVLAFQSAMAERLAPVVVDAWEGRAQAPEHVVRLNARRPAGVHLAVEIPVLSSTRPAREALLDALVHAAASAKVRTGGTTASAIPPIADLASFLWDCARAGLPFKATAGLHHRLRGEYRLTYAPDSPSAMMHGFLNVFAAAAIARAEARRAGETADGAPPDVLAAVIGEQDPQAFALDRTGVRWRALHIPASDLADTRSGFALSFGSCSFDEPVADVRAQGVLD